MPDLANSQKNNNQQNSQFEYLRLKWSGQHKSLQTKLWEKHTESLKWLANNTKQLAASSLGSLILLSAPMNIQLPSPPLQIAQQSHAQGIDKSVFLISDLSKVLPQDVRPLSEKEEKDVLGILQRDLNINIVADLNGKRLNRNYGFIGAEQHLARFPGDNINNHFDSQEEVEKYASAGMAPGLGAWGYFASVEGLTEQDKLNEKYYIAVPTFLSENFSEKFKEYINFFKYRKMLVVNPNNGKAIVTVVGDAGPAVWTGKHLGGSPEVMSYLKRFDGSARGPVLYFFIDDPQNKVPLGPLMYNDFTDKNSSVE
ncbi:MAG: hypothetical protein Q8P10_02165 [bacterium]|nr:hypothetical protein [bacterium]